MASPAQVANVLDAQEKVWRYRKPTEVAVLCRDAARIIRRFLNNEPVDGRAVAGIMRRLDRQAAIMGASVTLETSLLRASATIGKLADEARQ